MVIVCPDECSKCSGNKVNDHAKCEACVDNGLGNYPKEGECTSKSRRLILVSCRCLLPDIYIYIYIYIYTPITMHPHDLS